MSEGTGIGKNPVTTYERPLDQMRTMALQTFDNWIRMQASGAMRADRVSIDERKVRQAEEIKRGVEPTGLLKAEAEVRGITPDQMADLVLANSKSVEDIEIWRIKVKVALEKAADKGAILAIWAEAGLPTNELHI